MKRLILHINEQCKPAKKSKQSMVINLCIFIMGVFVYLRWWKSKKWSQGKVVELLQMVVSQTMGAVYIKTIVFKLDF